jgi:esterase/lipase superfamily enzyme/uncharacterized surface protein with fasciclin (FAS1) repeats
MYASKTIEENAANSPIHTTLVAAVKAAGLVDTLNGEGPFTVFAPTNDAFAKLPSGVVDTLINPENKTRLTDLLRYHVIAGRLTSKDLLRDIQRGGGSAVLRTLEGSPLIFNRSGDTITITDSIGGVASITTADVLQSNGIVHVIDSVLEPSHQGSQGTRDGQGNYQVVRIFYATDRTKGQSLNGVQQYTGERSPQDNFSLGTAEVSIPRDHKMGELEAPSLLRLEFRNDPAKHVVLLSAQSLTFSDFRTSLDDRLKKDPLHSVLIFVHGYNVTFEDAARRLGQMTYDLGFNGVPLLYSWPSKGTLLGYTADEASAEWSAPHFTDLLKQLNLDSNVSNIFIVGHSMGARIVSNSLATIAVSTPAGRPLVRDVVFAAPDIDFDTFKHLAKGDLTASSRITVYESSQDIALLFSHRVHDYPRLGDTLPTVHVLQNIECIEASALKMDFLGHSYIGESQSVLGDLYDLLMKNAPASQRFRLAAHDLQGLPYWSFKP